MDSASERIAAVAKQRRQSLGLRQEELADLAGVSIRFVHSVEHAKQSVRLDKLLDLFEVLGLDLHVVAAGESVHQ